MADRFIAVEVLVHGVEEIVVRLDVAFAGT
jgi:hypothetical protein